AALELGATITRVDPADVHTDVPERLIESRQCDADAVTAYLETVHLVADELLWAKQRAELLTLLDGGTVDEIVTWLTEQRIVFPGFEREVAARVMALAEVHSETMSTLHLVQPSRPPEAPKRERARDPLVFPQRSNVHEEALVHQLALF
ncbi:MAG: hypothetical protein JNM70_26935, partial [Anaerolineae bacterium]|nr:hypothetical protein [Anaerolineae bacterium]